MAAKALKNIEGKNDEDLAAKAISALKGETPAPAQESKSSKGDGESIQELAGKALKAIEGGKKVSKAQQKEIAELASNALATGQATTTSLTEKHVEEEEDTSVEAIASRAMELSDKPTSPLNSIVEKAKQEMKKAVGMDEEDEKKAERIAEKEQEKLER